MHWFLQSFVVAFLLFANLSQGAAADASLITIKTPRGAKQAFILIKPDKPVASVILFAGGKGALGLKSANAMAWGNGNFLVRTRERFAAHNIMVAVVDAPSDHRGRMSAIFRMSQAHAGDIAAVAAYLRKHAPVPVWLVGTSMGTFSAAGGAIAAKGVDGLVLSSTVTRSRRKWKIASSHPNGVASMALSKVRVPTMILSHKKDGCVITPAADAPKLKVRLKQAPKVTVTLLDGGSPPKSGPCKARSQHGFLGIEDKAVAAITGFITANGR